MNVILRAVSIGLTLLILLSSGGGIAAAHTALVDTDPGEDATVTGAPTSIVLTFNEAINPAFADVAVTSADGRKWSSGSPQVEGPRITAVIGPDRPSNGEYTVAYRVVSADGHPVTGSYIFTITGVPDQGPPPSTSVAVSPSTAAPAPPEAEPAGADTTTSVITAGVAGLALGGMIAFWQSLKRRRKAAAEKDTLQSSAAGGSDDAT